MIEAGQKLGEFEILEQIGRGGMGAVYKARQTTLRRVVAMKTLQPALASNSQYVDRFHNEAVAAAGLNHPNLVQVHAAGETDGVHWFAMEFVEGETVRDRLKRKGRLDTAEAIAIATHVATALEYGWRKARLIHRDIKPDNIFLSQDGEVKLGDLGLAKSTTQEDGLTITGASMGTPRYISPEQAQGKKDIDLRADIYSLGCTLFHLVSGQQPFFAENAVEMMLKHVTEPVPELREVWPECPEELSGVVMKMMSKSPAARQQTYAELIADLRGAYDALTGASVPALMTRSKPPKPLPAQPPPKASPTPPPPAAPQAATPQPGAKHAAKRQTGAAPAPRPQPVAAQPATPRSATTALRPAETTPSRSKSKLPLIAIAVVAVVGVALFFIFHDSGPKLSEAERAMKEKAANAPGSSSASVVPKAEALKLAGVVATAEPWQDVLGDPAKLVLSGEAERTPDGLRLRDGGSAMRGGSLGPKRDGAVRMRTAFGGFSVELRARVTDNGRRYSLRVRDENAVLLKRGDGDGKANTTLHQFPLREPLKPGQEYELELRVVGQTFTAKLNGKVLGTVTDGTYPQGGFGVAVNDRNAPPALVKALDVLDLDGLPEADALKLAGLPATYPQPRAWTDVTADFRKKELASGDVVTDGDWLKATRSTTVGVAGGLSFPNHILRVIFSTRVELAVRRQRQVQKDDPDLRYYGQLIHHSAQILLVVGPSATRQLSRGDLGLMDLDGEHEAVIAAQGEELTLWLDGKVVATAHDSTLHDGTLAVGLGKDETRIKKIEYGELPDTAPGGTNVTPATPATALTFAGHRYQLVPGNTSWIEAKAKAERMGGHLVTITSSAENDWIRRTFVDSLDEGKMFWIGATNSGPDAKWRWVNGDEITFTGWAADINPQRLAESKNGSGFCRNLTQGIGWSLWLIDGKGILRNVGFLVEWDDAGSASSIPATALPFGGHRYQFIRSNASWSEAKAQAEALGGHLATITSPEEHAWFLQTIAPISKHVWLGGRRQADDSWAWITGEPWKFTAWARHEDGTTEPVKPAPGTPPENALEFGYYPPTFAAPGGWNDEKDRERTQLDAGYLVEWDDAGSGSTTPSKAP
jgi:serine/threonine protein kinase